MQWGQESQTQKLLCNINNESRPIKIIGSGENCSHSSVDGYLSCFHVLAIVNSASVNTGMYVFFQRMVFIFSGYLPRSKIASKEIQPVHPKRDQSWVFIGRTNVEAETSILWPPDSKRWLTGKDPDAGKDWGQERRVQQRMRWLDDITDLTDMSLSWEMWRTGKPGVLQSMGSQRVRLNRVTEQQLF